MSIWEFLARSYLGALALMQTYWPALLIVAVLVTVVGWLVSDRETVDDPAPAPLPRYLREAEVAARTAWDAGLIESEDEA